MEEITARVPGEPERTGSITAAEKRAVTSQHRLEVSKRRYYRYIAFVVTITLIAVVVSGYIGRNQLLDCVQEGGTCHAESQRQTGEVVQDLLDGFQQMIDQLLRDIAELLTQPNGETP